jgi:quercetin dioxygenase-like cupin family protein
MKAALFLCAAAAAAFASPVSAKSASHAIKWMDGPPGLPSGSQFYVVSGDPGKAGHFAIRVKVPADYAAPPHWHPTSEVLKVLSGTLHYGMSDKLDLAHARTLAAGHSATMKAKVHHWVHASAPATFQVSGKGPFQITYVDPKDDPRKK